MLVPVVALSLLLVPQSPSQDTAGASKGAGSLDSAGIQEAIGLGRQSKKAYGYSGSAWKAHGLMPDKFDSNYQIVAQGPFGRVATAAAKNARNYLPFTADSVRADMTAPVLTVIAYPDNLDPSGKGLDFSESPERVLLQSVSASHDTVTLQPTRMDTIPAEYGNLFGAKISRSGLVASFDLRTLPQPPFDIIVVNSAKEARLHVKPKDVAMLR